MRTKKICFRNYLTFSDILARFNFLSFVQVSMTSGTWILMWYHLTWIGWPQKVSYSTEIMLNPFVHLLELPLCQGSIHTKWEDKYVFEIVNISLKFEIEELLFYILPYLERFLNWFSDQIRVGFNLKLSNHFGPSFFDIWLKKVPMYWKITIKSDGCKQKIDFQILLDTYDFSTAQCSCTCHSTGAPEHIGGRKD